jgi:drug/metabolite transporter (DMT)-like permease
VTSPSTASSSSTRRRAWIAWAAVCLVWGTTFLAIKISLETVPPFVMSGTRYVAAGIMLAAILGARGRRLPPPGAWAQLAVQGFFMMVLGNGGVVWGEQFVPSGLTSVTLGTSPFWMVSVNAIMPGGDRLHVRQVLGLLIGFSGITLLVWPDISTGGIRGREFALGVVALQIACAGWAIGANYTRRHVMPHDVLGAAAMQMILGGLMMVVIGTATGEWGRATLTARTAVSVIYLAIAGSVIGFTAFSYALRHLPVAIVSLHNFINPVIAVALGTLVLGEPFHARMILAAGIIVAGVLCVGPTAGGETGQ